MRMALLLTAAAAALSACSLSAQGATPVPGVRCDLVHEPVRRPSHRVPPVRARLCRARPQRHRARRHPPARRAARPPAPPPPQRAGTLDPAVLGGPAPVGSFVLGDSISLSAGIGPVLGRYGYPVVGLVGQSVSDGYLTTHLSSPAAQAAPAWVIELGTNNRGDESDVARLTHYVDLIDSLRTPGAKQRVLWVTPYRPVSSTDRTQSALDDLRQSSAPGGAASVAAADRFRHGREGAHRRFDADSVCTSTPSGRSGCHSRPIAGPDAVPAKNPMPAHQRGADTHAAADLDEGAAADPVFDNSEG